MKYHPILLAALLLTPPVVLPAAAAGNPARSDQSAVQTAILTSLERYKVDPDATHARARQNALEYLSQLPSPVSREVATALAIAQTDADESVRQAARRAAQGRQLKLDVPALLLDALGSDQVAVRMGAGRGISHLKLAPAQIQSKVVAALMKADPFVRADVKRFITALGEPLRAAVFQEIQARYAKATDARVKIALLRALGRDSAKEKPLPEALPLLGQALGDSSAEVRLAAAQTLRWLESPFAWVKGRSTPPNLFRDHPAPTAQIVKALQAMLKDDDSAAGRAAAAGCLAELRQPPELMIAALGDKAAAVRSVAAQGLCNYERPQLQAAIPALQKLAADAACKTDAEATLGYIQDESVPAALANKKPLPSLGGLSPEDLLKETARRADSAAKLSLALQAERIPFPNDLLAHYSAQLCLNRNRATANARLRQELRCYDFGDSEGLDGTKIPLVYALHYSRSRYYPGTFTPETEALFKQAMFSYVDWRSQDLFNEFVKDVTRLPGTENQSLQYHYGLCFMELALLNDDPAYAARRLRGGQTVAQYYAEWNAYMKQWMRSRALNGFWIELGSHYSSAYSLPAIIGIYVAATDPETRQLTKMFLDLALVDEAQASYGSVRGGSRNRIKENDLTGAFAGITGFLYEGKTVEGKGGHQLATSGYRAPAVAVWLRNFEQYPPQPILIANRRFGEFVNDRYVEDSKLVNTIWKTRHYMLGSMLRYPKTVMGPLCNQADWNGIVFADGQGLFPACPYRNPYFSYQHQNVLILQRDKKDAGKGAMPMSVLISLGLEQVETNGWVFIKDGDAYAGIKILKGGYSWPNEKKGNFLTLLPENQASPILIEAGDKDAFGSFAEFKAALQANTISVTTNKVEYSGPKQPRIEFFYEATGQTPQVDGQPFSPDPKLVYSSPFMQRQAGESLVTVTVGGKRVRYDFEQATITEAGNILIRNQTQVK